MTDSFESTLSEFAERQAINDGIHTRPPIEIDAYARCRMTIFGNGSQNDLTRKYLYDEELSKKVIEFDWGVSFTDVLNPIIKSLGEPFLSHDIASKSAPELNPSFLAAEKKVHAAQIKSEEQYPMVQFEAKNTIDRIFADIMNHEESKVDTSTNHRNQDTHEYCINGGSQDHRIRVLGYDFTHSTRMEIVEDYDQPSNFANFDLDAYTSLSESVFPTEAGCETCVCKDAVKCRTIERTRSKTECRRGKARRKFDPILVQNIKPPQGLLVTADYWVLPIEHILKNYSRALKKAGVLRALQELYGAKVSRGKTIKLLATAIKYHAAITCNNKAEAIILAKETDISRAKLLVLAKLTMTALSSVMRDWIQLRENKSPRSMPREDFVGSFVFDGLAILFSDLRPDMNVGKKRLFTDKQTRSVILDLGLNKEGRGRLIQRLMDVAAFRNLALRELPYTQPAIDAINSLSLALGTIEPAAVSYEKKKRWIFSNHNTINPVTERTLVDCHDQLGVIGRGLKKLNYLFTYGIEGKWASTLAYTRNLNQAVAQIQEVKIPGFQTLQDYLSRYHSTIQPVSRLNNRYKELQNAIKEREHSIQVPLGLLNAAQLREIVERQSRASNKIGYASIAIAVFSLFTALGVVQKDTMDSVIISVHDLFCDLGIHVTYPTNEIYHVNDQLNKAPEGIVKGTGA